MGGARGLASKMHVDEFLRARHHPILVMVEFQIGREKGRHLRRIAFLEESIEQRGIARGDGLAERGAGRALDGGGEGDELEYERPFGCVLSI